MRVANIKVTASGPKQIIKGSIYTTGLSNVYSPAYVQSFSFVPGGDLNFFQARIERFGETNSLIIKFDTKFYGNIIVTGIELNAHNDFNFSIFRFLALFAISFLVISAFIFKLYKVDYDESKPLHKLAFAGSLLLCLSYSVFWLYYTHPSNTVPWVWRYVSGSTIQLSTPDHSLLYDLPHSKEEISEADIYPQLLDAFNKGQFNIDVFVDPRMMTLDNPWDSSERVAKGIRYYHERTFYNGKYYIYYGLAPLFTVYYPVYWLTGKLPTPMLVAFILSFLSVCMIFLAVRSLVKFFKVQPNILLLCLGSIAITSGSLIFAIQSSTLFYGYLTQSWVIWFCFLVVMLTEACSRCLCGSGKTIRRIMLALCGVSIFMMVQSRPASLIYGLIFATPFLWKILREKSIDNRDKIFDFASIGFTTLLGALFSMWYNYARFDSVFEFGIFYNVSSDFRHNFSSISPHSIAVCLYYYFLEPFVYSIEFPFVEMRNLFHQIILEPICILALMEEFLIFLYAFAYCYLLLFF